MSPTSIFFWIFSKSNNSYFSFLPDITLSFSPIKNFLNDKNLNTIIKGYLEDFALSKNESDELIMSARNKIYKDWVMKHGKQKNKINNFWQHQEIN